jgi:hypothetical protein
MKLKTLIQTSIAAAGIAAMSASTLHAATNSVVCVQPTFNAVEAGMKYNTATARVENFERAYVGVQATVGPIVSDIKSFNEMTPQAQAVYFGDHRFTLGLTNTPVRLVADVKATESGIFSTAYGLQLSTLPKWTGATYGYADLTLNPSTSGLEFHLLHGKVWGKLVTTEFVQNLNIDSKTGDTHTYTELQALFNVGIAKNKVQPFVLGGMSDFKPSTTTVYGGVRLNF